MASHRTSGLALLVAAMLLGGCVYRPDIQQGNLLSAEDLDQVTVGMTRSQVRYLLGTPMVSDPFAPHRWDYVYRLQHSRHRQVDSAHFIVFFEGDKVVRFETLGVPRPPGPAPDDAAQQKPATELSGETREPPPTPSIEQPRPDSPRPEAG
jgi:outer membrane protein assembly factor BamE